MNEKEVLKKLGWTKKLEESGAKIQCRFNPDGTGSAQIWLPLEADMERVLFDFHKLDLVFLKEPITFKIYLRFNVYIRKENITFGGVQIDRYPDEPPFPHCCFGTYNNTLPLNKRIDVNGLLDICEGYKEVIKTMVYPTVGRSGELWREHPQVRKLVYALEKSGKRSNYLVGKKEAGVFGKIRHP